MTLFTVAVTVIEPAAVAVSVTEAAPFVVVFRTAVPLPLSTPPVATNSTAVPFGTGLPLSVTVAVMVTVESTSGSEFDAVIVTFTPVGGGVPPGGVPPEGGGAVGVSPLHAASSSSTAIRTIHTFRALIVFICPNPHPMTDVPRTGSRQAHPQP